MVPQTSCGEAYRALTKASFAQWTRRLREWTAEHVPASLPKNRIWNLWNKKDSKWCILVISEIRQIAQWETRIVLEK